MAASPLAESALQRGGTSLPLMNAPPQPFDPTALIEAADFDRYDPEWYAQSGSPAEGQCSARSPTAPCTPLPKKSVAPNTCRVKKNKRPKPARLTHRRASNVTAPLPSLPAITKPTIKTAVAAVAAAVSTAKPKSKVKDYSNKCRDMRGKSYNVKKLREKRNRAIMKGMKYMKQFLRADKYKALYAVGDDAACIFFEIWYTSQDQNIRHVAKDIAKELLRMEQAHLLKQIVRAGPEGWDTGQFFSCLYMLRCTHEMGLPCERLLHVADQLWEQLGLKDTSVLFGRCKEELDEIETDPWIDLLLCILIMEMIKILFNNRFPIQWGLAEALTALKKHRLTPPPMDANQHFHDSFYLATHTVYAINAYQSIPTHQSDCPWLYKYIRVSLTYWMKMAWRAFSLGLGTLMLDAVGDRPRLKPKQKNKNGIDEVVDIDGVGEAVDVLRGAGMTEANDCLLTEATQYLLKTQNPDGSWPVIPERTSNSIINYIYQATFHNDSQKKKKRQSDGDKLHPYDELHPTWVATQALRDRDYKINRPGNVAWAAFIERTMRKVKFYELGYEASWCK